MYLKPGFGRPGMYQKTWQAFVGEPTQRCSPYFECQQDHEFEQKNAQTPIIMHASILKARIQLLDNNKYTRP